MPDIKEELSKVLQERAGLDQATAQRAADAALTFLKEKGPSILADLRGGEGLGGLLGR
jgi:hypothetical protein